MMPKFLLLIVLMFLALGLAAVLMRRMMGISEKIADLHNDMKKSQVQLDAQMQVIEEKQTKLENSQRNDVEEKNS